MKKLIALCLLFFLVDCTYSQSSLLKVVKVVTKGSKTEVNAVAKKTLKRGVESNDEVLRKGAKKSSKVGVVSSKSSTANVVEDILQKTNALKVKKTDEIFNAKKIDQNSTNLHEVEKIFNEIDDPASFYKQISLFERNLSKINGLGVSNDIFVKYLGDVEKLTGRMLGDKQKALLYRALSGNKYSKLSSSETVKSRYLFGKEKASIIREWEKQTGNSWPRYEKDVVNSKGVILRKKGQPFDAHHLIENSHGGEHKWWNIHPARFPNEHQGGIHGMNSTANEIFK